MRRNLSIWMGALGLLSLAGFGALGYQLVNGLGVTGMNNATSWGLYITMFMFFVGLSAGGLIVSSSATVFNIPSFKVVAKPATILSTVCIIVAGIFIMVDIGSPFRVLNLLLHSQFKSPLMWDVCVISLYLTINVLYLYLMTRAVQNKKLLKIMSCVALPVAILVHSVTAWIFGLQIAREGWHSALMAPLFVASALDSGLALLIIVLVLLIQFKVFIVEKKLITTLAGLLVTCVAVDAYFVFSEILTMFYPQEESVMLVLNEMLKGTMAPFFWGEVILGFVIPLAILLFKKNREKTGLVIFSSVLIVIGVFFKRVWLLFTSFIHPHVEGAPGITLGTYTPSESANVFPSFWTLHGQYAPTLIELMVVFGMISFGALLFIYLSRRILMSKETGAAQSESTQYEAAN
ncbi:NrfD/PsrC family molybdoenzyme membrane anchor subunit [Bacillus benzoevorans]|uniref:Molybdopterin-containing oxidoreductase family membrane subunit n=1 Tax=Bacillus benzoevorans TaxID=1456 RepID=A0A7X0LXP1_9BACI|nr:NrfD/PsrC family molybdoenzyme membrane anchor subunit [Bacillus benzoevorans]MBB6446624.1 molybdopterin-containing oxidoreductase family membrane subunit [Bacillus benzoevorans]